MSIERRSRLGRWIVLGGAVLVAAGAVARLYIRSGPRLRAPARAASPVVRGATRVKVEVLNATDTKGLARAALCVLRDAGFDVVFFGNTVERADTTRILDRSGHSDWAVLAARAMGRAHVEERPDSTRFLDLTILVGRNWVPPTEPLCP